MGVASREVRCSKSSLILRSQGEPVIFKYSPMNKLHNKGRVRQAELPWIMGAGRMLVEVHIRG